MWDEGAKSMTSVMSVGLARSFLFVPGDRSDRFEKARNSGADFVICDLEDAVAPNAKNFARQLVCDWLGSDGVAVVRINSVETPWFESDYSELVDLPGLAGIMIPKAEDPAEIARLAALLGGRVPIIALIETAVGIRLAFEISRLPGVARLAFGAIDFALDIECSDDDRSLLLASSSLVLNSRAAGLPAPIAGVTTILDNPSTIRSESLMARSLGYGAKLCIHPKQVSIVNNTFSPSEEEVTQAKRVLENSSSGVSVVDGHMVDKPILIRAERTLQRAALFPKSLNRE